MVADDQWLRSVDNFGVRNARGDAMTNQIDANAVLFAIPNHARPSWSSDLDAVIDRAARTGWTEVDFIAAVNAALADYGPTAGTGAAVHTLRRIAAEMPPRTTTSKPKWHPHIPCTDPSHDARCVVCRCDPEWHHHHVSVPMPREVRRQLDAVLRRMDERLTTAGGATTTQTEARNDDPWATVNEPERTSA